LTKATTAEGNQIRRSISWLFSRRGMLKVTNDSLICGDWIIHYPEISEAVLFELTGAMFPGYILRIKTHQKVYQFGLGEGRFWNGQLPFPCVRDSSPIGYSWFTFTLLLSLASLIGFRIWCALPHS
jgi:hypothetical protein